ncbi:hypothetical protein [Moellerella wisconsensis]|uniref:Uncharacterized protein n=1 Tax=Moellerella wisconsensis TaxID=158849 RepID=A0A9Q8Q2M7_9GAMM|nr:hypothetical protein [Moellerella wisconsensis]UNH31350.1 hypothetical protein MNY72_03240 [Moellerella wisconsensis]
MFLKKLITGQYSLAVTFWLGWVAPIIVVAFIISEVFELGFLNGYSIFYPIIGLFIIRTAITGGIFFALIALLRKKVSFWRLIVFLVVSIELIISLHFFAVGLNVLLYPI